MGGIVDLARRYAAAEGADELVFYDITASSDERVVDKSWVSRVAEVIDIPFCVAGGIKSVEDARQILEFGADKVSINSPALADPTLITRLAERFRRAVRGGGYRLLLRCRPRSISGQTVYRRREPHPHHHLDHPGVGAGSAAPGRGRDSAQRDEPGRHASGYDLEQLKLVRAVCKVPLIASGGAGAMEHFRDAFTLADVDGALAASVFHKGLIPIPELKRWLKNEGVAIRE